MTEAVLSGSSSRVGATPMHVRILEQSLGLNVFLNCAEAELDDLRTEPDQLNLLQLEETEPSFREHPPVPESKKRDLSLFYNFEHVEEDRAWLKDLLLTMDPLEDTTDPDLYADPNVVTEKDLQVMLKQHVHARKHRKKFKMNPKKYQQYKYYGASFLSKLDMYTENKKSIPPKKEKVETKRKLNNKTKTTTRCKESSASTYPAQYRGNLVVREDELELGHKQKALRTKTKNNVLTTPEQVASRRRKLWAVMAKKEMSKIQRLKANNHKEQLQSCKRTAQLCMKVCRQKAMQSQKNMKETIWRCKRLTREMQAYWKRYDRVEREMRRRMEKEAEEQRKMDVELIEAKRQQRKLNFLITQTELYAHFMSRKLGKASPEEQLRILSQLEERKNTRLAPLDDYDSDIMKMKAKRNVIEAIENDRARTKQFDKQLPKSAIAASSFLPSEVELEELDLKDVSPDEEHPQPSLFKGHLKTYQLKGMNWLANLYDQGISGILADEMGLGKTVQSIAFLCHVAEKYSVWGPFLVISPASTLHNWQQEMARFVPDFHVVPYWGNPNERKILRQFWEQKDLHTKEASFHVVITSYQIIITDFKYFNRIKWQYMILDEAQAIKSSSSVRWKMLLGFSCRNRLLLSGTPIQNSMAELWALLHFIMPTLFDSHDEFNEWFSKDIENHVENKTGIDEKHLSRLHMILKPFMLRRIKKDVENELSDKIEIMVYCPLTRRQKLLYMALKKKIRIEDLLHYTVGGGDSSNVDKNFTSNLMNLVMQFRKVCNHPELFERRDAKSPLFVNPLKYTVPKLIYTDLNQLKQRLLFNQFYIWAVEYLSRYNYNQPYNGFSFRFFTNLSPASLYKIFTHGISQMWTETLSVREQQIRKYHSSIWWDTESPINNRLYVQLKLSGSNLASSNVLKKFVFTHPLDTKQRIFKFGEQNIYGTECKKIVIKDEVTDSIDLQSSTVEHYPNELRTWCNTSYNQPLFLPPFLNCYAPKVESKTIKMYCSCSANAIYEKRIHSQENLVPISDPTNNYSITSQILHSVREGHGLRGWFNVIIPDKETLVTDAGKLAVLDPLLKRLKKEGHRVLIYSQMTKMIDLLEEYMWHRKHKYMRLDGSSKISERRDMVADFQARSDIFVFLLSTRAGGLGINLTAADTVIFYDSDWNPTVDQQAMDRAHRLGQTKQVTVYRLICKGTIEERILQRAREKSEIQRMVISGGNFKPDTLKPKEVVSLLLDDEEIESKYRQRAEERKHIEEIREKKDRDRKRKNLSFGYEDVGPSTKRPKDEWYNPDCRSELLSSPIEDNVIINSNCMISGVNSSINGNDESSSDALLDVETTIPSTIPLNQIPFSIPYTQTKRNPRGTRRGRPRGSRRGGGTGSKGRDTLPQSNSSSSTIPVYLRDEHKDKSDIVEDTGQVKMTAPIRRGPGRPRLKPVGPGNQGGRSVSRPRKAARSLPVPLRAQTLQPTLISTNLSDNLHNLQFQPSYFNFYGSVTPPSSTV